MPKLKNLKHELFCQEYMKDMNGTRAYLAVYPHIKTDKAAQVGASRLLSKDMVDQRVTELSDKACAKIEVTVDWILRKMVDIVERTTPKKIDNEKNEELNLTLAKAQLQDLAKYKKMLTDKVEHSGGIIEETYQEQIDRLAKENK